MNTKKIAMISAVGLMLTSSTLETITNTTSIYAKSRKSVKSKKRTKNKKSKPKQTLSTTQKQKIEQINTETNKNLIDSLYGPFEDTNGTRSIDTAAVDEYRSKNYEGPKPNIPAENLIKKLANYIATNKVINKMGKKYPTNAAEITANKDTIAYEYEYDYDESDEILELDIDENGDLVNYKGETPTYESYPLSEIKIKKGTHIFLSDSKIQVIPSKFYSTDIFPNKPIIRGQMIGEEDYTYTIFNPDDFELTNLNKSTKKEFLVDPEE